MVKSKFMISYFDNEFLKKWKNKFEIIENLMNKNLKFRSYEFCFDKLNGRFILEIRFYNITICIAINMEDYEEMTGEQIYFYIIIKSINNEIRKIYYN